MHVSGRTFWLLVLGLTLLLRSGALGTQVIDTDEAGHAVHSMVWMDGGIPYVDFVDNKQPLLYATYAAVFAVFGRNLLWVHWFTIPWLLLTAWVVARLAKDAWRDEGAARVAALLFTLFSSAYIEKDMLASNTEVFMNLPLAAAFWLVLRRGDERWRAEGVQCLLAGLLLGVATLYNIKAGVAAPILALALVARHRGRGVALTLGLGLAALAAWAPFAVYLAARGAFDDFIYWNFILNQRYAAAGVPLWTVDLQRGILYGIPRLLLFLAASGVGWVSAAVALRRMGWRGALDPGSRLVWIALWLLGSFGPVCMGGRFYGHYFVQFLPPLAALAAGPLAGLLGWSTRAEAAAPAAPRRTWLRAAALAAAWLPILALTAAGGLRIARGQLDGLRPEVQPVARYVRENTCPEDRIFVWGYWSQIYYFAQRPPATRFVYAQTLSGYVPGNPISLDPNADTSYYIVPEHWDDFAADVQAHPPELLLDVAPAAIHFWEKYPMDRYPVLQRLVTEHYSLEAVVEGVRIYRRRAGRGSTPCQS